MQGVFLASTLSMVRYIERRRGFESARHTNAKTLVGNCFFQREGGGESMEI